MLDFPETTSAEFRALTAAFGAEWVRQASYVERYAAMVELGFVALTPEIKWRYGCLIEDARKNLPWPRQTGVD